TTFAECCTPLLLEAYDESDPLIRLNDVPAKLSGALVCITCTIERALLVGSQFAGGKQWQFYANVVKLQTPTGPVQNFGCNGVEMSL
ncbi:hypothetical protein FRC06_010995, partial [Ceratobasidium sp. 370]